MATTVTHWINGAPVEGTSGRFGDVTNPATGEVIDGEVMEDDPGAPWAGESA